MQLKVSLIIATYNWEGALELVLKSVLRQDVLPDEVIIADDGSGEKTKLLIDKYVKTFPVPLIHIWHEDKGFRLSAIRNKAIKEARFDYIVQIDGDVVLHPKFIYDHKKNAQKECFVTGSRVLLGPDVTRDMIENKTFKFNIMGKDIYNRFNGLYCPLFNFFVSPRNKPLKKMTVRMRGCNMAFWREDLIAVNGYDEDIVGWGREDSELVIRLLKKGLYRKKIKLAAIQYHLFHKENSKENLEKNIQILNRALSNESYKAKNGIFKLNN